MTADQVARDLCGVISDVPVAFTFGGEEYEGTRGALVKTKHNVEGGMFEAPELTITTCRKRINASGKFVDRFATEPSLQGVLTSVGGVSGRNYRIVRVHEDEFGIGLQWDLESVDK